MDKMLVYYPLTDEEIKHPTLEYTSNEYTLKSVNLSLSGLIEFIKDYNLQDDLKHYVVLPLSHFKVIHGISHDGKDYNTATVSIPFTISTTGYLPLPKGLIYHGSKHPNVKIIMPRPSITVDNESVVFAGDYWAAVSYTRPWTDNDIIQGTINHEPYLEECYHGAFKKIFNRWGYVYTVPSNTFVHDKRVVEYSMVSRTSVRPIAVTLIEDQIKTLDKLGVNLIHSNKSQIKSFNWS